MTRERGAPQRSPLSPLDPAGNNGCGRGAAAADAVGSSTKDRAWQQQRPTLGMEGLKNKSNAAQAAPQSDKKKKKKVEGTVALAVDGTAGQPPAGSASRIPAGPRTSSAATPSIQQQQAAPTPASGGSRIPRPPAASTSSRSSGSGSPQSDLLAMLATPAAAPLLPELHAGGNTGSWRQIGQQEAQSDARSAATEQRVALQGFHAYSNPSFDGAAHAQAADSPPAAARAASSMSGASTVVNHLAVASVGAADAGGNEGAEQLTPGLLDPAALTPNSERSLQAWLCSSPPSAPAASGPRPSVRQASVPPASAATAAGSKGRSSGRVLPTPEAWHLLQHINEDSPAAAPQGVRGIMNAYLRTGPQALSPEPAVAGTGVIRAPGATAVPATGILNVAGPGGAGVYGMMNAYMRTGANILSPEPGIEDQSQQQANFGTAPAGSSQPPQPQPLLHPYSPVSPLAATPAAALAVPAPFAAASDVREHMHGPTSPSVCSNGDVGSASDAGSDAAELPDRSASRAPSPVPRLNLAGRLLGQQGGTDGTEISLGAGLAAASQASSPEEGELPTARLSTAVDDQCQQQQQGAANVEEGVAAQRQQQQCGGVPSPITFCLPGDSPLAAGRETGARQATLADPASHSPSFSFGIGNMFGGEAAGGAAVQQQAVPLAAAPLGAAEVCPAGVQAAPAPGLHHRVDSGETVQQPTLYNAMLDHLRGPQYASPARFAQPQQVDSPQSPQQCTPLHLISTSDAPSPPRSGAGAAIVTPAPGQGSLTVWMDRRGMRGALNTPARNDLRLLWDAARHVVAFQSEAAVLRADNASLLGELEAAQAALRDLGQEHEAAVVAAEAGALCAEAEVARARDAAGHMMALADQIQGMFALCENEKESLVQELAAAQQKLAQSEAAAADTAHLSERQRAQLQAQLEEARQAVAAAQAGADAAQQRASDAAAELESIQRQLAEAQEQLEAVEAARAAAHVEAEAAQPAAAPVLTPVTKLRSQLGGVHDCLAQLHAEHCAGRLQAANPELDQLAEQTRAQLARIEALLGADPAALRAEKGQLLACLERARSVLAKHTPATAVSTRVGACGSAAASEWQDLGRQGSSPVPFALFGRLSSDGDLGGEAGAGNSPAASAAAASPDVFASPFLAASQTTLTVNYRDLQSDLRSSWRQQSDTPASRGSSACSAGLRSPPEGSPTSSASGSGGPSDATLAAPLELVAAQGGDQPSPLETAGPGVAEEGAEQEYTVVHNGMIITHVPASEISKVRSMVQYWEAVASGTPMVAAAEAAGVTPEEAAVAEAYASAAVAAATAALAAQQSVAQEPAVAAAVADQEAVEVAAPADVAVEQPPSSTSANCSSKDDVVPQAQPSPAASPSSLTARLPAGEAATPCSLPASAAAPASDAGTPAKPTPLNFASAPPPTPAEGIDPQQAGQLHHLAVGMAAVAAAAGSGTDLAGTPASAQRTTSRLPATPVGTPVGTPAGANIAAAALAVTPLALSALRARMGGSGGGVQDVVRSRLARLKADLQAAQAKLATVDQGLASIAFTPTSSAGGGTPSSRGSSILRTRSPATPSTAGPLGSPIASGSTGLAQQCSPAFGGSSCAAALIAAGTASPLAPGNASPPAVSQPAHREVAGTPSQTPAGHPAPVAAEPMTVQGSVQGAVALAQERTPPVTRRSVRFADTVRGGDSGQGALRLGTPYSAAAAEEPEEDATEEVGEAGAAPSPSSASPVVGSCKRGMQGWGAASPSPARGAGQRRSPLAPMQSAVKSAGGAMPARRFVLDPADDESGNSSSDEDSQLLFDASRMAQAAHRRASMPSPSRQALASPGGATPMAHPERPDREAEAEEEGESYGSYPAGQGVRGRSAAAAAATPATSVLSTSSFSPPQPLVLLAVRPLGRARRGPGGLLRAAGAGGRLRGEAEEREFRRRAAALKIQISPYFRRGGSGGRE